MIKVKQAPAGWIAQLYSDVPDKDILEKRNAVYYPYLGVCGRWCPTKEEAVQSVKDVRESELKKLEKKREKFLAQSDGHISRIKSAQEVVVDHDE